MPFLDNFRAARWLRLANLLLQALLVLTLVAGLNYVARDHPVRFDFTRSGRYSLSPETLAYLRELPNPVRIVVTTPEDAAPPELRGLLREYEYATESGPARIRVDYLDVDLNRREAEDLHADQAGLILLLCGDNRDSFPIDSLYRPVDPRRREFSGEEALTGGILQVTSAVQKRIYFLVGHGELAPDDVSPKGLSTLRDQLRQRNYQVDALDLSAARRIPADATLLIAVYPKTSYTQFEDEELRQYLRTNAGRLILFLAPGLDPTGLDSLLQDWALVADNDLVCDSGARNITEDGDLIVRDFRPDPITRSLVAAKIALRFGPARTIRIDATRAQGGDGVDARPLALASPTAWGQVNPASRSSATYNPRIDLPPGGLCLAAAAEPVAAPADLPFSVPRGRLVVFGTGDLPDNIRIGQTGVLDLLMGAVNWSVGSEAQLSVPPRPIEQFQLSLSAAELRNLRFSLLFALPGATLLLGLIVYWTRRH